MKVSKYRGLDKQMFALLKENKQMEKAELRKKFCMYGETGVNYSINSLEHKKLIQIDGTTVRLL